MLGIKAWAFVLFAVVVSGKRAVAEGKRTIENSESAAAISQSDGVKKKESKPKKEHSSLGKDKKMSHAPEKFKLVLNTTKGKIVLEAHRSWSPKGVDRLYELVQDGFFKDIAFFRVVENFVVQFGIHGDPSVSAKWRNKNIEDDPVTESNKMGYVTFATAGPGTRTTQMFINLVDNSRLDSMGFSPIAKVTEGMDVVKSLYSGYGERPDQGAIQSRGNVYLKESFEKMDYIKSAEILN